MHVHNVHATVLGLLVVMLGMSVMGVASLQEKSSNVDQRELFRDIRAPFNGMRGKREPANMPDIYNRVGCVSVVDLGIILALLAS